MSNRNFLVRLMSSIWTGVDGVRKVLHLLLLVTLFLVFAGAISGTTPILPKQAALFIQPEGPLVEQLDGDPYDRALAELLGDAPPQTLVQDVIDALVFAKTDDRISAVHLELSALGGGGLSKLRRIGEAIDDFKESGKPVVASADYFSQSGYYLAAHADELYMHPDGMVFLQIWRQITIQVLYKTRLNIKPLWLFTVATRLWLYSRCSSMQRASRLERLVYLLARGIWLRPSSLAVVKLRQLLLH